jgi:hypothetical protein
MNYGKVVLGEQAFDVALAQQFLELPARHLRQGRRLVSKMQSGGYHLSRSLIEEFLTEMEEPPPPETPAQFINIAAGLGKTAAVVLAWLWNRLQRPNGEGKMENGESAWPRRLV